MKRQNVRKLLLIISMLLFPVTIWYMSPYLIIQGAMEGIVTGSCIIVGAECIQCGACVDHCPKKALSYGFTRSR